MPKFGAEIELLGRVRLVVNGEVVDRLPSNRLSALLGYLALHDGWQPRETIAEAIWPDMPDGRGLASLRNALSVLRRLMDPSGSAGGSPLESTRTHCRLSREACEIDLWRFDDAVSKGDRQLTIALYKGELLPNLTDAWIEPLREERRFSFVSAMKRVGESLLTSEPGVAIEGAKKWLAEEPFDTTAIRLLALGYAAADCPEAGVYALERFLAGYLAEWDEEPALDKKRLMAEMDAQPRFQPKIEKEGPVISPAAGQRTLPLFVTKFFGRESELATIVEWALGPSRLLTIAGMGGMGKTRLAVEAGEHLISKGEKVVFVSLASAESEVAIVAALLDALNLRESEIDSPWTVVKLFVENMQDRLVLILDNVEQIVPVAAPLVLNLLQTNPQLKVLCTTREVLSIEGEQLLPLQPFETRDDALRAESNPDDRVDVAVQMFLDRARSTRSDFAITERNRRDVIALCHELDGLPLAIEIMAGWAGTWSVPQMRTHVREGRLVSRKRGHDPRHQSLQACIDWSFNLLEPATGDFLSVLSLFRGGWTLEAAQAVTGDRGTSRRLAALFDRSLISSTEVEDGLRFFMLESVRAFGSEKLREGDVRAAATRFVEYFTELAKTCTNACAGQAEAGNHRKMDRERENIEAAVALCEAGLAPTEEGLKLVGAAPLHWIYRGQWRYGSSLIDRMLAIPSEGLGGQGRILALQGLTVLSQDWGDVARADQALAEFRALAERHTDPETRFRLLTQVGNTLSRQGKFADAVEPQSEALRIAEQDGLPRWTAIANCNLAEALFGLDRIDEALPHFREAVRCDRENGNIAGEALSYLGFISLIHGDPAEGREMLGIYLRNAISLQFRRGCIRTVHFTALAAVQANQPEFARQLLDCAKHLVASERVVYDALEQKCAAIVDRAIEEAGVSATLAPTTPLNPEEAIEATLTFLESTSSGSPPTPNNQTQNPNP